MTKNLCRLAAFVLGVAQAVCAHGHGTPIHVEVHENRLVVSQGITDPYGYAPVLFLEDDEDGEPFGSLVLPQIGPVIVWRLPGFEIFGMDEQSGLSIEVLLRPAKDADSMQPRLLWHWNPATETVSAAANAFYLLGTGMRVTTLEPAATDAPDPFLLADPIAGQQGFHNHNLLSYALDDDPTAPAGAYGFFARLTSDVHAASDPFLLVFNRNVDPSQMASAGLAINAAAFLPGDYNHDDRVDAADYVAWRDTLGSTTELGADGSGNEIVDDADYDVWRAHFGQIFEGSTATASLISIVPEPGAAALAAGVLLATMATRSRRRRIWATACRTGPEFN